MHTVHPVLTTVVAPLCTTINTFMYSAREDRHHGAEFCLQSDYSQKLNAFVTSGGTEVHTLTWVMARLAAP